MQITDAPTPVVAEADSADSNAANPARPDTTGNAAVIGNGAATQSESVDGPPRGGAPPVSAVVSPSVATQPPAAAMTAADFPAPPARDPWALARQMRLGGVEPREIAGIATALAVGDEREFWTLDYPGRRMVSNPFRLAAVSEHAYWWLGDGVDASEADITRTVEAAEAQVFPRVEAVFGEAVNEAEGQGRLHIIGGRIPGVGGYVSGGDQYPASVSTYSNEVPAIYINTHAVPIGDEGYLHVLAHELQHSIHQIADESEATWLNEGLAELAVSEAGYRVGSLHYYLLRPDASLVNWPDDLEAEVGLNYGASALFAHYLREHYATGDALHELLAIQEDGIAAVDRFLHQRGATAPDGQRADFHSVFADWVAANFLDADGGPHGYDGLNIRASITRRQKGSDQDRVATLPQYSADYVEITDPDDFGDAATVRFEGMGTTPLLATDVDGGCWWSNRGDSVSATLTRRVSIPQGGADGAEPMLAYRYWHDIEEDWDYLYLSASTDDGRTWAPLPAEGTTDTNPLGNSYGFGYTGNSRGWKDGEASLAAFAGSEILVRFHYVTDDAINGPGFCVQDMRGSWEDSGAAAGEWVSDGFVMVNNRVRQDWIVWVIRDGGERRAERMVLEWDAAGDRYVGAAPALGSDAGGRLVIAVSPTAPATMEEGEYRVWVEE